MTRLHTALTAEKMAQMTQGELLGAPNASITGGCADSRRCRKGDVFVAMKGERTNGNLYIEDAWKAGAAAVLAKPSKTLPLPPPGKALIKVKNPLKSLQNAAARHRESHSNLRVVGITGSNGKTTTKEIVGSILRDWLGKKVLVSEGNFNSDIGLPLTLMRLDEQHEVAVLEMGMNKPGEMDLLSRIAQPDVAVITNVGNAHVGLLGSERAVAEEKRSVLNGAGSDSVAVVGFNQKWTAFLLEGYAGRVRFFGKIGENGWDEVKEAETGGYVITRCGQKINFLLPGAHNLQNAMAAVEAALALGVSEESIVRGLESVRPIEGRSQIIEGFVTILNDSYNASPESLEAALNLLDSMSAAGRRIVVLGEMAELGEHAGYELKRAGEKTSLINPDTVFFVGECAGGQGWKHFREGFGRLASSRLSCFESADELLPSLREHVKAGDIVLLKGSRKWELEKLIKPLQELEAG